MFDKILQLPYGIWLALGLLIAVFIGATLLVVNTIYLVMKKRLQPVAEQLGGHVVYNLLDGPFILLEHKNIEHKIFSKIGGQNTLPSLLIKRSNPLKLRFHLIVKQFPQVPVYLHFQRGQSIKTGDDALDEQLSIKSDSTEWAEVFFHNSNNIEIIKFLLDNGYQRISGEKDKLLIQKWGYDDTDLSIEKINIILDKLNHFNL